MNKRLLAYLRSLGLAQDANDGAAWEFFQGLRGVQRSIANNLNYVEADQQARTTCDLALRSLGYDPETLELANGGDDGNRPTVTATAAPGNDGSSHAGDLEAHRQRWLEEEQQRRTRITELGALASGVSGDFVRGLADDPTVTVEDAQRSLLEEHRRLTRSSVAPDVPSAGPAIHTRATQTQQHDAASLAAGLMMRHGVSDPTRRWCDHNPANGLLRMRDMSSDEVVGRAVDQGYTIADMPLVEVARRALAADGVRVDASARAIANAFQTRSAMSLATFTGMYTQVFGALLLNGFEETADTTGGWTVERDNPNFFSIPRVRPGKATGLTKHAKGGTADDVSMDDKVENTKVNRYSAKFIIDEMDLINDTFGALNDLTPQQLGASARRIRPDLVYAILMNNPTMRDGAALFSAGHKNLNATSPFSVANLQKALTSIAVQKEGDVNLNLAGRYVIVPQALRFTARETIGSAAVVIAGDTNTVRGVNNALSAEDLMLVSDSRLDNGVTDPDSGAAVAGSTEDYYVAASAGQHTIEVTYLRGSSRSPEIRAFSLDRGQFGVGFDVKEDIGATPLSWEGICKNDAQ